MSAKREEIAPAIKGGIVAGVIGGVIMAGFLMGMTAIQGGDVWMAAKGAGTPFMGARAMQPGFDAVAVIVGVLSHLAVSIAWAVPFALLAYGLGKGSTVLAGGGLGIAAWLGMFYVVLPIMGLGEITRTTPIGMAVVEHLVFGVSTAIGFLPFQHAHAYYEAPTGRLSYR